ncbi:hypothetical protein CSC66_15680 [Pseudoxanthomonas kaohsiungensis]|nr:hypothetical protein CSC66_15680 [Pseudoxanthomonas kaohsiungensis]
MRVRPGRGRTPFFPARRRSICRSRFIGDPTPLAQGAAPFAPALVSPMKMGSYMRGRGYTVSGMEAKATLLPEDAAPLVRFRR